MALELLALAVLLAALDGVEFILLELLEVLELLRSISPPLRQRRRVAPSVYRAQLRGLTAGGGGGGTNLRSASFLRISLRCCTRQAARTTPIALLQERTVTPEPDVTAIAELDAADETDATDDAGRE